MDNFTALLPPLTGIHILVLQFESPPSVHTISLFYISSVPQLSAYLSFCLSPPILFLLWLIFPFCSNERAVAAGLSGLCVNPSFQLEGHLEHKHPEPVPEFN